jgi:glycosyltransferase involved in cell wall biosynthesis
MNLSVALAVYNEEGNLGRCLTSVKGIADEIVVVDGGSTDRSVEIARDFGARVIETDNPPVFHINKQKALDACHGDWILQLDADEEVSTELAQEISEVVGLSPDERRDRRIDPSKQRVFLRHQRIVERRDGTMGNPEGEITAYFVPRLNYFLGGPIRHAGTYPDGVIRLVKNGNARFPARSVHEQIVTDGAVSWLSNDLYHYSNPSLAKYWKSAKRYIYNQSESMREKNLSKSPIVWLHYLLVAPVGTFFSLFVRHKGFIDGWRGLLFCAFSSLHYPLAFMRFIILE